MLFTILMELIIMSQMPEPVIQLLKGKNFAYLSTLMDDGSPQVTPIWIDLDEDSSSILTSTVEGRIKHKNVSRDRRVAISISDENNPYNMVLVTGRVIGQIKEGAVEYTDRLAKKYLGVDKYPFPTPIEKRVILKIKSERVFHQQPFQ
jgi:PPOX class probable F420-dependent enzyme